MTGQQVIDSGLLCQRCHASNQSWQCLGQALVGGMARLAMDAPSVMNTPSVIAAATQAWVCVAAGTATTACCHRSYRSLALLLLGPLMLPPQVSQFLCWHVWLTLQRMDLRVGVLRA